MMFGATSSVTSYDDLHLLMVILAVRAMEGYVNQLFLPHILDDLVGIFTSMGFRALWSIPVSAPWVAVPSTCFANCCSYFERAVFLIALCKFFTMIPKFCLY